MAIRRSRGTGSISVRLDGKADAQLKVIDWDGTIRRIRKRLPSEKEAERWLVRVRYEHEKGTLPSEESERLTLGEYLDTWLKETVAGTVSRHTYHDYADKVRLHIKPVLGRVRLRDLTQGHLQRLYRVKFEEGLSPRSGALRPHQLRRPLRPLFFPGPLLPLASSGATSLVGHLPPVWAEHLATLSAVPKGFLRHHLVG